jgi:cold shock CspA family protein
MPLTGTLKTWNDDRGFGFITPAGGGSDLFVHISAFPRDGSRPIVGESLSYELGRGKDGKAAAVRVYRQTLGRPSAHHPTRQAASAPRRSLLASLFPLVLVVALGSYGYSEYKDRVRRQELAESAPASAAELETQSISSQFRCDGRTYCSQMTSCSEAKFFINHCPGTKMDGNNDGVPCEQQWCTSPLAK